MKNILNLWGIEPNDFRLYTMAFSHSSYVNEHKDKTNYERLEFLGDAVLELCVSDYLYSNYNKNEGDMTKQRASFVCENALYQYMLDLDIVKYIKVGQGEVEGGIKKAIIADTFEALIGAIYLDQGFMKAKEVVLGVVVPYIENSNVRFFNDYKSALQEAMQTTKRSVIYETIKETGPAHHREFTIVAKIDNIIYGKGVAGSKKKAAQNAAKEALEKLVKVNE